MTVREPDPSRLARARDLFEGASELPAGPEREAYLARGCGADRALRAEVDSLLGSLARAGDFLEDSVLDPAGAFWIGRRIGGYEIVGLLGRGGVGLVFEALQDRPRRTVALKILRPEVADAAVRRRFEVEAELLGALRHEGIARVHAAGTVETDLGPQSFLAMERVEGRPLLDHARAHGLGTREKVALIERTCAAVQHAHERGVVHRDLKPGNVLVEASGQPKVLDFGVARAVGADLDVGTVVTAAGQILGTVAYMSPEQARGESERVDVRADVHALGVMLYELLADRLPLPVSGKPLAEAIRCLSEDDPTPLSEAAPGVPGDLATVVGKAIERDAARRYASVADLAEDLRRFLRDEPVRARPPSTLYQLRKLTRRHRGLFAGLALVFLLLAAGVVTATLGQLREQRLRLWAERSRGEAERALALSDFDAYAANLAVAEAALAAADVVSARRRLGEDRPGPRGWEWTHLRRRLDRSEVLVDNGTGIESMGLTADGAIAVTGGTDRSVRAWRLADGELLWERELGRSFTVRGLAVDPRGEVVAAARGSWFAGRGGYGPIELLDLADGSPRGRLEGHGDVVQALAFHPARPLLVSASSDGTVRLWDVPAAQPLGILADHALDAYDVAFSPDGRLLASVGWDGRVHVIDVGSWRVARTFDAGERIVCVGWSPDAERIACGTWNGRLVVFDRASGARTFLEDRHAKPAHAVVFSADGRTLLSGGADDVLQLHDLPRGTTRATFLGSTGVVTEILYEQPAGTVLSAGLDGRVRRWSARTQDVPVLATHEAWVYAVSLGADGRTLASAGPTAKGAPGWAHVQLVDLETGAPGVRIAVEGESTVWSCEAAPDSARLVTAGTDTGAVVWDAATGERLVELPHEAALRRAVFDPTGRRVATSSHDRTVRVWDSRTGELVLPPLVWEGRRPFGLRFSPDGARLAATYYGGGVALWDARDGALLAGRTGPHVADVYVARFAPDGRTLVTAGKDRRVQRWDGETLLPQGPTLHCTALVHDAAFLPDGSRLFVGTEAGLLHVFETEGWREVLTLHGHQAAVRAIAVDARGRFVYTGGADGAVRAWDGGAPEERRVDELFGQLVLADDVAAAVRADAALDAGARERALALVDARRLAPDALLARALAAARDPELRARDRDAAIRRARAALEALPEEPDGWNALGALLHGAGELDAALDALERGAALRDGDPWNRALVALVLATRGEDRAARRELGRVRARLDEEDGGARDAALLATLRAAERALAGERR